MGRRLSCVLVTVAALACLPAANAFAAGPADAALSRSAAVSEASARRSSASDECGGELGLGAPAPAQEATMLCLVNDARARFELPPMSQSPQLRESAVDKADDLLRCDEFSHTACGRPFYYWIDENGYMSAPCWRVGENLAWGVEEDGTVGAIFRAWMRSPTHRANILGNFDETGIELRVGPLGGLSGVHLWTEHFGSHCGS
jgi:uncharacterized protein YkwD